MKTKVFLLLFLLTLGTFLFFPDTLAQGTASNNIVRIVYFVPRQRQPQPDIDTKLDTLIKTVQKLFADEMERHGFGRKTFVFETDRRGNAVVHHMNGRYSDAHYHDHTDNKVHEEVFQRFEFSTNIYLMVVDISSEHIDGACGKGGEISNTEGDWGGQAYIPASGHCLDPDLGLVLTTHELGHAFSLSHDFSSDAYIMSYGVGRRELGRCAAEWLDVSRYFNSRRTPPSNTPATFKMLPPTTSPDNAVRFRFEVRDSDGLQHGQLITQAIFRDEAPGEPKLIGCKKLEGKSQTVEFVTTELTLESESVTFRIVDGAGNYDWETYPLDMEALLPSPRAVSIPDANLAEAIRETLALGAHSKITQLDMLKLRGLFADNLQITDLRGLEYARNLKYLSLRNNEIKDIAILRELTNLAILKLSSNHVRDFTSIVGLTKLLDLDISHNLSDDITPIAELTQLQSLDVRGYRIQDLMPFTRFTNLIYFGVGNNQISDLTPLAELMGLEWLDLSSNRISDLTPIENLTQLRVLQISNNQNITDISPIAKFRNLTDLVLLGNQVSDLTPIEALTNLETLIASYNQITDIAPLTELKQLRTIWLSHNQVRNLKPLTKLFNIVELKVAQNPIVDRTPLQVLLNRNSALELDIDPSQPLPVVLSNKREHPPIYWTDAETSGFYRLVGAKEMVENAALDIQNINALTLDSDGKVYWTEQASSKRGNIGCANLNGTNAQVVKKLFSVPRALAIDTANGEIYTTNTNGRIQRFNTNGSNFEANLIRGLDTPKHIALDVGEGKLYWTEAGESIRRANFDGSDIETLATDLGTVGGIAIAEDKLYWTEQTGENTGQIQRANLDGTSIETLTSLRSVPLGIAVDQDDRKIYWSNAGGKILRSNLTGKNVQTLIVGLGRPTELVLAITPTHITTTVRDRSGIDAQGRIVGPWLWMIAPTPAGRGGAASTNVDSLAAASNRTVREAKIARNGASEGDSVGNRKWTLARIRNEGVSNLFGVSEEIDNVTDVVNRIGWAEGDIDHHSSYALITLESATAQRNVTMHVGSDDSIKVWLNGKVVHRNPMNRGSGGFQDSFRVNLKKGDNLLLVKVSEATGHWSMFVGVDADVRAVYKSPVPAAPAMLNQLVVDVNQDGQTDLIDLYSVASYVAQTISANPRADVNQDGVVDAKDVALVAQHLDTSIGTNLQTKTGLLTEITPEIIQQWIDLLNREDDGSLVFQHGIANLHRLMLRLIPKETALLANYPNPFNPETWIPYQLANPADVTLTIYAANGVLVRTLGLGHQPAGIYQRRSRAAYWDGRNEIGEPVASGIYFYTLSVGNFTATRKMIIVK